MPDPTQLPADPKDPRNPRPDQDLPTGRPPDIDRDRPEDPPRKQPTR